MKITERTIGEVTFLDLSGKIVLGAGDAALRDEVGRVIAAGSRKVVLNLGGVSYMDSAGLGELVRCHSRMSQAGGSIKLLNLTKRVNELLVITKLVTVFESFESEAEAAVSF